ncbi:interleukin-8-like [Amblyraja radiata]|uniref:interleukin-8-like n=1 Tax=Amblyraja radiata TaxID=386614 RepID=UPI001403D126|nr:interleukin-8-like [Amblyraja radiata]
MDRAACVTILILLLCVVTAQGIPILGANGRCHCARTRSVHPKSIRSLKFIPRGPHCENAEIIVTQKNGKKVCVDPEAKWLEVLITANKGAKQGN